MDNLSVLSRLWLCQGNHLDMLLLRAMLWLHSSDSASCGIPGLCITVHTCVHMCEKHVCVCVMKFWRGHLRGHQLFGGPLAALYFSSALTSSALTKIERDFPLVRICLKVYAHMVSILEKSRKEGPGQFCHASRKMFAYDTFKTWSFSHYQHHPKLRDPYRCLSWQEPGRVTGRRGIWEVGNEANEVRERPIELFAVTNFPASGGTHRIQCAEHWARPRRR